MSAVALASSPAAAPEDLAGYRPPGAFFTVVARVARRALTPRPSAYACKSSWWQCRCDCGRLWNVPRPHIISGNTRSCGCMAAELQKRAREARGTRIGRRPAAQEATR
jgi:hypothetical protein